MKWNELLTGVKTRKICIMLKKLQDGFPGYDLRQVILRTTKYTKENYILW